MMKKLISLTLAISILVMTFNLMGSAEVIRDDQYNETVCTMGDLNGDGEIKIADCNTFMQALVESESADMKYEAADVNGDFLCDTKDMLILKKYIAGYEIEFSENLFGKDDEDVTSDLTDLGKNNFYSGYNDSNYTLSISRYPYDMITVGNQVLVSGGNYNDNTGPVRINTYTRNSEYSSYVGRLNTEQVNRFYSYDSNIFALAIDSIYWGKGDLYVMKNGKGNFRTRSQVFANNIHCYDMAKYGDNYFFAGSSVHYDGNYKGYSGGNLEMSQAIVYRFTGEDIAYCEESDFEEVPLINKYGEVLNFKSHLLKGEKDSGITYYMAMGVPRIYDFFEWNGNLYALHYDQYSDWYDENYGYNGKYNYNGFYKYDEEKNQFIYDSSLKMDGIVELFQASQDFGKLNHDFQLKDKYYFIGEGMKYTSDFVTYNDVEIPGYEGYVVHDAIMRFGKVYLLCSSGSGSDYTNYVFETEDFESFRPILHFSAGSYAKSFEYCNGSFFFGLGAIVINETCNTECGRIYRYNYYK